MAAEIIYVTVTESIVETIEVEATTIEPVVVNVKVSDFFEGVPFGVALPFFGQTPPTNFAFPVGQTLLREDYPKLAEELAPDNTSEFWIDVDEFLMPDLRDTFLVGKGTGLWSNTLNQSGGSKDAVVVSHTHSSTLAAPAHTHSIDPPNTTTSEDTHNHDTNLNSSTQLYEVGGGTYATPGALGTDVNTASDSHTHTVNIAAFTSGGASATALTGSITTAGVSGTDANLPPYTVCNYIMRLL